MAYTKFHDDWKDYPDLTTPVTAAALEQIEQGISDATDTADAAIPKTISGVATDKVPVYNGTNWVAQKIVNAQVDAAAAIEQSKISFDGWADWDASPTGFSSLSVEISRYFRIGKLVVIQFKFTGTSNATTCGFTLPFSVGASSVSNTTMIAGPWTDNGSTLTSPSRLLVTPGSSSAACDKALNAGGGWTASGVKSVGMHGFAYEVD